MSSYRSWMCRTGRCTTRSWTWFNITSRLHRRCLCSRCSCPGRPTIQQRVLDALSPDARSALLNNKVRASDASLIRQRYHGDVSPWPAAFKKEMEFEHAFVQAGGLLLAGLDPTGMGGVIAGFGDQREVELLVEAGFTPVEAIHIATANGAQYLGELDRIGTIAVGKQADLVVIKGDPSKKIEDIENVETVFKDGSRVRFGEAD